MEYAADKCDGLCRPQQNVGVSMAIMVSHRHHRSASTTKSTTSRRWKNAGKKSNTGGPCSLPDGKRIILLARAAG
jgi:hypothetical protein